MRSKGVLYSVTSAATATTLLTQLFRVNHVYASAPSRTVTSSPLAFTINSFRQSPKYRADPNKLPGLARPKSSRSSFLLPALQQTNEPSNDTLSDDTLSSSPMPHYYHPTIGSTQDEARLIVRGESSSSSQQNTDPFRTSFAVSSGEQTKGRGTSGRTWIAPRGNTFLTVAFPFDAINITPTLLPLRIGCIVARRIRATFERSDDDDGPSPTGGSPDGITLKWPNDVLVHDKKIAGVLIESETDPDGTCWFVVGIGVNWTVAPEVDSTGPHRGRDATCVRDHIPAPRPEDGAAGEEGARRLGYEIATDVRRWLETHRALGRGEGDRGVVREWESWAVFGTDQVLRDTPGQDVVTPLGLEPDGRLRVRVRDGGERLLCADYLL